MTNWPTKKLGEICEIIAGQAPPSKYYNDEGKGIPFLTVNSFGNIYPKVERWTTKCLRESKEGDVLFSVAGSLGLVNLGINACITRSIFALRPLKSFVLQKFLFYTLKKYGSQIALMGSGTAQKVITINQLSKFEIPLPPLPIQQKIVKILDTIQSAVEVQEKIIEKTKELKKSLMAELFKYGGPSFRKGRKLKKTETLNHSELGTGQVGEIPEDWEVVRLGDEKKGEPLILTLRNGLTYKQHELQESGIPITRIETIADGKIDFEKVGYLKNIDQNLLEEYKLKKGDILFSHINSEIHLGKTAIYLEDKFILHGMNLLLIRPNSKFIDSKFLNYLFNWYKDNGIFISIASRAVNQASINQNTLKNLKIPLLSLSEQQEIAEILQTIDYKIEIEKKKKELYEELFKTMLNKIMSQEIDVEKIEI
jgi:type I restriction enzyme S subunit